MDASFGDSLAGVMKALLIGLFVVGMAVGAFVCWLVLR
jgi:hypothetical protein